MKMWESLKTHLVDFLKIESQKAGFNKAVLGLSGGIDSAVVSVLCKEAFGENLLCVLLPSQFSNPQNIEDAKEMCAKFSIKYETVSIAPMIEAYCKGIDDNIRVGNYSARMRMAVLYDISRRDSSLVIGTGNKTESMLGYGTYCGDLANALNPIADIYKTEIFEFAAFLGVTSNILKKPPSADLYHGQTDEGEIGHTYAEMDEFLKLYIEERLGLDEILKRGLDQKMVTALAHRIEANSFKRRIPKSPTLRPEYLN